MYFFLLIRFWLLVGPPPTNQRIIIRYDDFKVNGIGFSAKKAAIIKAFGPPMRVVEPHYECGFLSDAEQGHRFYSLQYKDLQFTGNATDGYQLEEIHFSPHARYRCTYKGRPLSAATTRAQLAALLGQPITQNEVSLVSQGADDVLQVTFVGGKLAKIEYWSPC